MTQKHKMISCAFNKKRRKNILNIILNLIYPQICSICGKINVKSICDECDMKLNKDFINKTDNYSKDISKYFFEHNYFFNYKGIIREQILTLKFQERAYNCQTIVSFLENRQKCLEKFKKYDIILIVPVSKRRKMERGYDQSEILAKKISQLLNIKIEKNIIQKNVDTKPQSTLNKTQRKENVKKVYKVKNTEILKNKRILIFDDIYTTGSTVNECARLLIKSGIERSNIGVLTIAKD